MVKINEFIHSLTKTVDCIKLEYRKNDDKMNPRDLFLLDS